MALLSILGKEAIKSPARLSPVLAIISPISHPVSVWLCCYFPVPQRARWVCQNSVCSCSLTDLDRILFVSRGKQSDQCMGVCMHGLVGFVYQREKSVQGRRWINSLTDHLSGLRQNQTRYNQKRERVEADLRLMWEKEEGNGIHNRKRENICLGLIIIKLLLITLVSLDSLVFWSSSHNRHTDHMLAQCCKMICIWCYAWWNESYYDPFTPY